MLPIQSRSVLRSFESRDNNKIIIVTFKHVLDRDLNFR